MVELFFELRYNNVYQLLFCNVVQLAVSSECGSALAVLLDNERLLERIVSHFEAGDAVDAGAVGSVDDGQRGVLVSALCACVD
jgi:hypothetical protein